MTSWIFGISADDPEHWEIAQREGLWDLTKAWDVRHGDYMYFWQSELPKRSAFKDRLIGLVRASSNLRPLTPEDALPWKKTDKNLHKYKYRVTFDVVEPKSLSTARWQTIELNTGITSNTRFGPQEVKLADGERWLRWELDGVLTEAFDEEIEAAIGALEPTDDMSEEDHRRRVEATIVVREGRGRFRDALVDAYSDRCAVTGTSAPVLDAAHIRRYQGHQSDRTSNGLLLRTDIHTLFDKHLLTIVYDAGHYSIRISKHVKDATYRALDGRPLRLPADPNSLPDPRYLEEHNEKCRKTWSV